MTDTYRALCAELVAAWDALPWEYDWLGNVTGIHGDLCDDSAVTRARALLDQPVAEGPSDEEIEEWADDCPDAPLEEMDPEIHGWRRCFTAKEFSETIRAAIARWGHPTPQPVAVSERLPGPEDCDAEERCWLMAPRWILPASELTHWLPANALPLPAGEGAS